MTPEERITQLEEENAALRDRVQNTENRLARLEQFMQARQSQQQTPAAPLQSHAESSNAAARRRTSYQLLFDGTDNTNINRIVSDALNDNVDNLWDTNLPFIETNNNAITERLASTIIDRTTIIMSERQFTHETREILHSEVIQKLHQHYRFRKRVGSDEGRVTFNRKRRRHQRKIRVMKRRVKKFDQMKGELGQVNTRFADGKAWLDKVELVSEYESGSESDDDRVITRIRPLYQSNLCRNLVDLIDRQLKGDAKRSNNGRDPLEINRVLTVARPFPTDKKGKGIAVPPWMMRGAGEQPPVDDEDRDSVDRIIDGDEDEETEESD